MSNKKSKPTLISLFVALVLATFSCHAMMPMQSGWYAEDINPHTYEATYQAACNDAFVYAQSVYSEPGAQI